MSDNKKNTIRDKVDNDPTKIDLQPKDLKKVPKSLWQFLSGILSIKDDVDIDGTIVEIKEEIEFKGHSVWI